MSSKEAMLVYTCVGPASITTRGMGEAEATLIGTWIADVLDDITNVKTQEEVKAKAKALTARFLVP